MDSHVMLMLKNTTLHWKIHTGKEFDGIVEPFGRLCFYRDDSKQQPVVPRETLGHKRGLFTGWVIDSGIRYRKQIIIVNLENSKQGRFNRKMLKQCPELEVSLFRESTQRLSSYFWNFLTPKRFNPPGLRFRLLKRIGPKFTTGCLRRTQVLVISLSIAVRLTPTLAKLQANMLARLMWSALPKS